MSKYHINAKGEPSKCRAWIGKCPFGGDSDHHETPEKARDAFEKSMTSANTPEPLKKVEQTKPAFEYYEENVDKDENGNVVSLGFEHHLYDLVATKNSNGSFTIHQDYVGSGMGETVFAYDGDPKDVESIGSYAMAAFDRKPILPAPSGEAKMSRETARAIELGAYGEEDVDESGNVIKHSFEHRSGDFILTKSSKNTFTVYNDYVGNPMGQSSFSYDGDSKDAEAIKSAAIDAVNSDWGKPSSARA